MIPTVNTPSTSLLPILPSINTWTLANSLADTAGQHQSLCQLLILDGQYIVRYQEGEATITKLISPTAVRQAFTHLPIDSGFLPPGVIRWGSGSEGDWLVKFVPPNRYPICCILADKPLTLDIPLPGLIFLGKGNRYYLWAVKSRHFDCLAPVFHVPLPNVSPSGAICFGSNSVPNAASATLDHVWQLFLSSPFNGDSASGKSKAYPDDVRSHLITLQDAGKKRYPLRDLIPYRSYRSALECDTPQAGTVEEVINRILS